MFSHKVTAFLLLQFLPEVQGVHTHFWCGIKARPPAQREAYTYKCLVLTNVLMGITNAMVLVGRVAKNK